MRSRAFREGSVGLLILGGAGLFIWLILWVRGIGLGNQSYEVTAAFEDTRGVQVGTILRYRGVGIGKATTVTPKSDVVEVTIRISQPNLLIPSQSIIEAQNTAFLGESLMDVIPLDTLPTDIDLAGPTDPQCVPEIILCDGSQVEGVALADISDLIRATNQLANVFTDPRLLSKVDRITTNAVVATEGIAGLGDDLSNLSQTAENEIDRVTLAVDAVTAAADQVNTTVTQANDILTENRSAIAATLGNFSRASDSLITALDNLDPIIGEVRNSELVSNFEQFSSNARRASAQILVATRALNNPGNLQVLQETLDSARVTFQNAQKITADLDEVTGDAYTRRNLRILINALGELFASADDLEQQIQALQESDPDSASSRDAQLTESEVPAVDWSSWEIPPALRQSLNAPEPNADVEAVLAPTTSTSNQGAAQKEETQAPDLKAEPDSAPPEPVDVSE
ncbi:MAG: MlaD family protein [Cyanobacteria bacterium P01_H01_bin.121]